MTNLTAWKNSGTFLEHEEISCECKMYQKNISKPKWTKSENDMIKIHSLIIRANKYMIAK